MQLFTSAGLLAVLTFGCVVSALPPAVTTADIFDPSVTYEEHIKQFEGSFKAPTTFAEDSLAPLTPVESAGTVDKRWVSTTCGPEFHLLERFGEALSLCDAAIVALEFPNDNQRRQFIKYFGAGYWNPTVRGIIRDRFIKIKEKFFANNLTMICLRWEYNNNAAATTTYYPGRPDLGATIRLYRPFWEALDPRVCGQDSKAGFLVHEGAHAAFEATDHGGDPAMDAYQISWYAHAVSANCPV